MFGDRFYKGERFFHNHHHESPFIKGDLKYVILDLLKEKPRYGYDIICSLEEKSHGFYRPSPGVIYPTLQMLDEMGYVSSKELDGKKIYTATEEGLKFLKEQGDIADNVRKKMKRHWKFENLDSVWLIMDELAKIRKDIKSHIRYASPEKLKRINEIITQAKIEVETILRE